MVWEKLLRNLHLHGQFVIETPSQIPMSKFRCVNKLQNRSPLIGDSPVPILLFPFAAFLSVPRV